MTETEPPNEEIPSEQFESPRDSSGLVNILSKMPGEKDEKVAWLASGIGDEILGGIDADMPAGATPKQIAGATVRLTIARYRTYVNRGEREFRGAGERAAEAARMDVLRDSLDPPTPGTQMDFKMNTDDL